MLDTFRVGHDGENELFSTYFIPRPNQNQRVRSRRDVESKQIIVRNISILKRRTEVMSFTVHAYRYNIHVTWLKYNDRTTFDIEV